MSRGKRSRKARTARRRERERERLYARVANARQTFSLMREWAEARKRIEESDLSDIEKKALGFMVDPIGSVVSAVAKMAVSYAPEEKKPTPIDPKRCMQKKEGSPIFGGDFCQEPATHWTVLGRRCALHAEGVREALRSPFTLINIKTGPRKEEEIERMVVELT